MVVLANNLYLSLTIQLNSTAVTTFELHVDEEVDNDNKLYKWYERCMVRTVYGTNGQWYEKSRHPHRRRRYTYSNAINLKTFFFFRSFLSAASQ